MTNGFKNQPFLNRLNFAWNGLAHTLRSEASFRAQAGFFFAAIVALLLLHADAVWWALILVASAGVLAAELLNTAIEQLADELRPENSPAVRVVKDCAAGAVLVAALGALGVAIAFAAHVLVRTP